MAFILVSAILTITLVSTAMTISHAVREEKREQRWLQRKNRC